ncbi:MAG: DUF1934 domain-containing protein [Cellulosilyticaceae bacterium]
MERLQLITTQSYEDEKQTEEVMIDAIVAVRDGSGYVTFKQIDEDTKATIQTIVKLKKGIVYIKRMGTVKNELVFDTNKNYETTYKTPYGELPMCIRTKSITGNVLQEDVNLTICYEIVMQGKKISDNIYTIKTKGETLCKR